MAIERRLVICCDNCSDKYVGSQIQVTEFGEPSITASRTAAMTRGWHFLPANITPSEVGMDICPKCKNAAQHGLADFIKPEILEGAK